MQRVNGVVAARIAVAVAEGYLRGAKAISRRALADRFDLSDVALDRVLARLKEADIVVEVEGDLVGVMPARPPSEISLADVLATFRGDDVLDAAPRPNETRLDAVLREIDADTRRRTADLSLADLTDTS